MKPGNLIVGLGLAGAGWWFWSKLQAAGAGTAPGAPHTTAPITGAAPPTGTTTASGATVTTGTNNPPAANQTPPPAAPAPYAAGSPAATNTNVNFSQYISNTLGAGRQSLSADSWNWYYSQWSGIPQTTDLFGDDRSALISLTEYLSRRATAGLSGLSGMGDTFPGLTTLPGLPDRTGLTTPPASQFRSAGAYIPRAVLVKKGWA